MPLPFPPLNSWTRESWIWKKQNHIWDSKSEHVQIPVETYLSPAKYCHLAGIATETSKGHSTVLLSQLLQNGLEHGKTSEFNEYDSVSVIDAHLNNNSYFLFKHLVIIDKILVV